MTDEALVARLEERIFGVRERADRLDSKLDGFPQVYALRAEIDSLLSTLNGIRTDYVQRRDLDTLRDRVIITEKQLTRLYGGMVVVVSIGVANLVKIFLG